MKTRGGYNIKLEGKPDKAILTLREPSALYLPLGSKRFHFSRLYVQESERILQGMVLASDPGNHEIPLLAPRSGVISLSRVPGHVTIEEVMPDAPRLEFGYPAAYDIPADLEPRETTIRKLIRKGAWQYFTDAFTGRVPDPAAVPQAVIISTVNLEPASVRGDAQLESRLTNFLRGLEQLQPLLEYQPIHLVFPIFRSKLGLAIREIARGMAWICLHEIPLLYPYDHPRILARRLGLDPAAGVVWTLRTEGILAIDSAITHGHQVTTRIMALGGPAAAKRSHFTAIPGYPLDLLREQMGIEDSARLVNGGALTGAALGPEVRGLDAESQSLTALSDEARRELLAFLRPFWGKRSYSRTFASLIRPPFEEGLTTAQRGERRPCISCGFCAEVCPVSIFPSVIHKRLYADDLDSAEKARPDLCIGCGLCSFVCTSKIDLRQEILDLNETLRRESAAQKEGVQA
jgi:Na(+)-translocating NADH:ubiquinone oxidoreductase A subunit